MSVILRMSYGSEFQAVGPVTEDARYPSFVHANAHSKCDRKMRRSQCCCDRGTLLGHGAGEIIMIVVYVIHLTNGY